jgi:hypothetical protein
VTEVNWQYIENEKRCSESRAEPLVGTVYGRGSKERRKGVVGPAPAPAAMDLAGILHVRALQPAIHSR